MTRLLYTVFLVATYFTLVSGVQAASFTPLGHIPGSSSSSSFGYGVSDNGSVVVGRDGEAFRWTAAGGMEGLGFLPGGSVSSTANAVSGDGMVVVGSSRSADSGWDGEAFRWTADGGMVALGDFPGGDFQSEANAVSADGSVIVGYGISADGNSREAFRWTADGGMVGLGDFPGGYFFSEAFGVSADGSVVVGIGNHPSFVREAFRWTAASGMVGLGDLPGGDFRSVALGVSGDGNVVVGESISANGREAFRWTADGGMVGLGFLPGGWWSRATDASYDGALVLGWVLNDSGYEAFVWTQADGMQRLIDVLVANGATGLDGWILEEAEAVSADGNWVVGYGTPPDSYANEAFLAFIAPGDPPRPDQSVNLVPLITPLLLDEEE